MKKIKKLLLVLGIAVCALCFTFGFAACENDGGNGSEAGSGSDQTQTGGNDGENQGGSESGVAHTHILTHRDEVGASCSHKGTNEHWVCTLCGKLFLSEAATNEVMAADLDIETLPHSFGTDNICTVCHEKWNYTEGLEYTLNSEGSAYAVSGIGTASGEVVIPYYYKSVPVTAIKGNAFWYCSGLTSIKIPNSVTSIEYGAFDGCSSLTSITIPNSVTSIGRSAFRGCNKLTSVTIPNSVMSIEAYAFNGCSGLTEIMIPDSVTSIGTGAFGGCDKLIQTESGVQYVDRWVIDCDKSITSVSLRADTVGIAGFAFSGCSGLTAITIPNSVTGIGSGAFSGCSGLASITVEIGNSKYNSVGNCLIETVTKTLIAGCKTSVIPLDESVTSIGGSAFSGCSGLNSITIPDSVTSIEYGAFAGCSSLTEVTIPNGVTSIGSEAFDGCSGLTSVTIGNSVASIGAWVFKGCSGLASITVESGNSIYHSAGNCLIETATKTLILGCKSSVIPTDDSVTSIGGSAFLDCSELISITIPNSVTSISRSAFVGCSKLVSVTFENTVGWKALVKSGGMSTSVSISSEELKKPFTAARYLIADSFYSNFDWKRETV